MTTNDQVKMLREALSACKDLTVQRDIIAVCVKVLAATEREVTGQGEAQVWIPVSVRMPEDYREVYAKNIDGQFRIARRSKKSGGCWQLACFGAGEKSLWPDNEVTHWCILSDLAAPISEDTAKPAATDTGCLWQAEAMKWLCDLQANVVWGGYNLTLKVMNPETGKFNDFKAASKDCNTEEMMLAAINKLVKHEGGEPIIRPSAARTPASVGSEAKGEDETLAQQLRGRAKFLRVTYGSVKSASLMDRAAEAIESQNDKKSNNGAINAY